MVETEYGKHRKVPRQLALVLKLRPVVLEESFKVDGVRHFVGLFDKILADGRMRLHLIPRAAVFPGPAGCESPAAAAPPYRAAVGSSPAHVPSPFEKIL